MAVMDGACLVYRREGVCGSTAALLLPLSAGALEAV